MCISKRKFVCEKDFDDVDKFLSDTYILNQQTENWDNGRWSFNRFCIHSSEEATGSRAWEDGAQIWEDGDKIIGVCHYEEPGDYFLQVHPNYKNIEEEMLVYALNNCRTQFPEIENITFSSNYSDERRKSLLLKYGGIKNDFTDTNRKLIIDKKHELPILPKSFKVINIDTSDRTICEKVAELYTRIWPTSSYMPNGETVMSFVSSPAFNSDLSFVVVNEKGEYVAFYILWSDSYNKHAHLYPFGIDPEYRDSIIPNYILGIGINKLYELGFENLGLNAWYGELEEKVFESYGFKNIGHSNSYVVKL